MTLFREINCALSCRTFFGEYISEGAVKKIADDFYLATAAMELVNVPFSMYIPFTSTYAPYANRLILFSQIFQPSRVLLPLSYVLSRRNCPPPPTTYPLSEPY